MKTFKKKLGLIIGFLCLTLICANAINAQEILYNYEYRFDLTGATEAPKLGGMPRVQMSEEAKKNGVEGTLKAVMILGADGKIKDISFMQTLPYGMEQSVIDAYKTFNFEPATKNGQPVDVKLYFNYIITAVYDERDKNVKKVKILEQPDPVYPQEKRAEEHKGEVLVGVLFNPDGSMRVLGVNSTMPKEFDKAAMEAAKNLKFEPAMHKKSKKPVSMKMNVTYKFKP